MILEVLSRARRRLLWNAMAAQGARSVCNSLALLILLLLLGTDILDWRYLIAIPAASLLTGAYLIWRRRPSAHDAAQLLDHRLGLQDALSTAAFYLPADPRRDFDEGMRQAQRTYAARLAEKICVREALPLRLPRLIYGGAALAIMACGLVGWRYSVHGSLDLRQPASPAFTHLLNELKAQAANLEQFLKQFEPDRPQLDKAGLQANLSEKPEADSKSDPKGTAQPGSGEEPQAEKQDTTMALDKPPGNQGEGAGEPKSANDGNGAEQPNSEGQQGRQDGGSSSGDANSAGSESSMMNKVRDTMANLLSSMKGQSGNRGGNQMEAQGKAQQQGGKSNGKKADSDRTETASAAPAQGDPQSGDPQAGKGGSPSIGQSSGDPDKQAGTGAGRDDGDKRIKLAEDREAMGKISVILGKRSKEVTGSTSMEVVSGEQELKTRYQNLQSKHVAVEDRGERDEVPVELQDYVRHYLQAAKETAAPAISSRRGKSTGYAARTAPDSKQK
jgi:hypothetical protein